MKYFKINRQERKIYGTTEIKKLFSPIYEAETTFDETINQPVMQYIILEFCLLRIVDIILIKTIFVLSNLLPTEIH